MSWSTYDNTPNNIHPNFPAIMNDGNLYTDWNPSCEMNEEIKKYAGIENNYDYRQWLIKNANYVTSVNKTSALKDSCVYKPQNKNKNTSKYIFSGCSDKSEPFGYEKSNLKNFYLSRKELESRMHTPALTQSQLIEQNFLNKN